MTLLDARERRRPVVEQKAWERRQQARLVALDPPKATKRSSKRAPER